jgi:hypothetical protein
MHYDVRLEFIGKNIGELITSQPEIEKLILSLVSQQPFAAIALSFLVQDQAGH